MPYSRDRKRIATTMRTAATTTSRIMTLGDKSESPVLGLEPFEDELDEEVEDEVVPVGD